MKRTHIIGIVWGAITVCLVSFGATVFFLDDDLNREKIDNGNLKDDSYANSNFVYSTDESSVRTNELAFLPEEEKNNKLEKSVESINQNMTKNINSFIRPVKGEILNPFSTTELIYSKTLQEWKIHNGTDYKAMLGSEVYATADGKIKEIKFDYEYGKRLVLEHNDGFESSYSNITALDVLKVGDTVKQGQIIGYVAESFGFEVAEETHLHFELKKEEKYISI